MGTWLVTGASGFLGRQVIRAIAARSEPGIRLVGLDRAPAAHAHEAESIVADMEDDERLRRVLEQLGPEVVIHAAGRTPPAPATELYRANTLATTRLLGAVERLRRPARVVLVGSAAELGPVPVERLPARESCPCRPRDPYGLSKWFAGHAGLSHAGRLEVMVGRIFNLIGPGMPAGLAFGRIARALAESGESVRLPAGDLEARRDFVDVRDAAEALVALALRGERGTLYHVGTGESRSIGEGLERLVTLSGRRVELAASERGATGSSDSRADITRIVNHTGWRPRISWEQSLVDLWQEIGSGVERPRRQVA